MRDPIVLILAGVVLGSAMLAGLTLRQFVAEPSEPAGTLQITPARGPHGVSITNREARPLRRCELRIPDRETTWVATVAGPVAPAETVTVAWAQFRAHGQPMPRAGHRSTLTLSCEGDGTRKSVTVRFVTRQP